MEARTVSLLGRHPLWLEAMRQVVHTTEAVVVACVSTFEALFPLLRRNAPRVLIIEDQADVTGTDILQSLARIRAEYPLVSVLVVSGSSHPDAIVPALTAGAFAYVLRTADPGDLAAAIRQAFERSFYLLSKGVTPAAAYCPYDAGSGRALTARERDVLVLVARGYPNVEIAERLKLSVSTVKAHLSRSYEKLGARNRTEAVLLANLMGVPEERRGVRASTRR